MPQILKSAKDGQIAVKEFYTVGDLAYLMGVAHATAVRLIDQREIFGIWLPTKRRQRRITHNALIAFVRLKTPACGTCSSGSTAMILVVISRRAMSHYRDRVPSAVLLLCGARSTPGRQGAARSPRRSTTQRRKSPSSSGLRDGLSSRSWTPRSSRASRSAPRD